MTDKINKYTEDFIQALRDDDKEKMVALSSELELSEKSAALDSVIDAIEGDAKLKADSDDVLKVLQAARDINTIFENSEAGDEEALEKASQIVDKVMEETEEAVVAEPVKEEAEEELPAV